MRLLITGASSQLGGYLLRALSAKPVAVVAWSGSRLGQLFGFRLRPVDLTNPDAVAGAFAEAQADVVIHAGALTRVADCFRDPARAWQVNMRGTEVLAELTCGSGARILLVSTDMVFDGTTGGYRESATPAPLSVYGRTKADAEKVVLAHSRGVVVRISLLFGPTVVGRPSFFDEQVTALRGGTPCELFADEWRTPLGLATAAQALLAVAQSDLRGVLHLGGPERLSRLEMGRRLAAFLGCDPKAIVQAKRDHAPAAEPRPRDLSLDSSLWRQHFPGQPWPTLEEALQEMRGGL